MMPRHCSTGPSFVAWLVLALAVTSVLPACTRLQPWIPVNDGADLGEDHVVHYEGVVVHVREFGVYDTETAPSAEIRTYNGSRKPVAFGIDGFKLDVGGVLVPARLDEEGEFPSIYLEPGEHYNTRLTFVPPPSAIADEESGRLRAEVLRLHLAPLVIDEVYHELPVLSYRAP